MTGVNEKFVWEFLRDGKPLPLENVPDEFFQYVNGIKQRLETEYHNIEVLAKYFFSKIPFGISRKEFAMLALQHKGYSSILFKMLEGKDYKDLIWKQLEPKMTETKKFNSFRGTNNA